MENNFLDERQEAYLAWLCIPDVPERHPRTNAAYARMIGVDETTLRRWKNRPAFRAEWARRVAEFQASPERTQQLLDNLFARANAGDNNAAKLYLQFTGQLAPVQVTVEHKGSASELSDAELDELIALGASSEARFRLETKGTAGVVGTD